MVGFGSWMNIWEHSEGVVTFHELVWDDEDD